MADQLTLPQPYLGKVCSLRQLAGELDTEVTMLTDVISDLLAGDRGYQVIQQLPGIGQVLPAVIGAAEAATIARRGTQARNIAKVAAAGKLLTLVYYGLRDHQIRALAKPAAPAARPPAAAA